MSIKSILCAYSGDTASASGLQHAINLANHYDGYITGVLSHSRPMLEQRFAGQIPDSVLRQIREADAEEIVRIHKVFDKIVERNGLADRSDFIDLDVENNITLPELARGFDLTVTGVHSHVGGETHMSANPDVIALRSGRPVLIVPDDFESPGLADSALVAWDGKRAAARAVGDAMHALQEKASVTVLTVGSAPVPGTDYLLRNLERHGANVTLENRPRGRTISDTILTAARDLSVRLIVMGAFEHSKFAHDLLGGVTTDVMRDAKVPVFMSH
jgi:nucleotide-binding universal stress UspA family protein